jgi:AraC-like DNA-binding protein
MDELSAVLSGPRAQSAFLLRSMLTSPWSLRILDRAPLTVVAVTRGRAWIGTDAGPQDFLATGDIAIVRGPDPYVVADAPTTAPQILIHPGQVCQTPDGVSVAESMSLGVRTWGDATDAETVMLTGTYERVGEVSRRLLDELPGLIVLRGSEWRSPIVDLLAAEIGRDEPGQAVVLDRLLDLLTVAALRQWLTTRSPSPRGWFGAYQDEVVGPALRLLHNNPAHPWTLVTLAAQVGVSRAALARRFSGLVGESPMAYLSSWRLALAADLLADPVTSVSAVSRQVGYASPFTFSAAYKRRFGASPQQHRLGSGQIQAGASGTGPELLINRSPANRPVNQASRSARSPVMSGPPVPSS